MWRSSILRNPNSTFTSHHISLGPKNLKKFLKTASARTFALLFAALTLGSLLSLGLRGRGSPITSAAGLILSPLQGISASFLRSFQGIGRYFKSSAALQEELARRDAEIASLRERMVDYHKALKENEFLNEFLEIKRENADYKFAKATIIGTDPAGHYTTYTLNRGSFSGIKVNDPVLINKYLVGVITKAELTSSTVETILNPNTKVSVYNTASGAMGVTDNTVAWAKEGHIIVPQLERSTFIDAGDLLATSGLGGIYPKDLIVGTVREILDEPVSATAVVTPAADFKKLTDVIILIDW